MSSKRKKKLTTIDKMAYVAARALFQPHDDRPACHRLVLTNDRPYGPEYGVGWGFAPAVDRIAEAIRKYQAGSAPARPARRRGAKAAAPRPERGGKR